MKYRIKFLRAVEISVEMPHLKAAELYANGIASTFPMGACLVASIIVEGYVEPPPAVEHAVAELSAEAKKVLDRHEGFAKKVGALLPEPEKEA